MVTAKSSAARKRFPRSGYYLRLPENHSATSSAPDTLEINPSSRWGLRPLSRVWGRSGKAWRSGILARIVEAEGRESSQHYREYYKQARALVGACGRRLVDPWAFATHDRYGRSTLIKLPVQFPAPTLEQYEARKAWEAKTYGPELFEFEGCRPVGWHRRILGYLEGRSVSFHETHKPKYGEFSGFNPYSKAILEVVCAFNRTDFVPRAFVCASAVQIDNEKVFA